jgi:hypothetical protein
VVICLALSVIGFNEGTIGSPSEYICPSIVSDGGTKIGSLESSVFVHIVSKYHVSGQFMDLL